MEGLGVSSGEDTRTTRSDETHQLRAQAKGPTPNSSRVIKHRPRRACWGYAGVGGRGGGWWRQAHACEEAGASGVLQVSVEREGPVKKEQVIIMAEKGRLSEDENQKHGERT